MAAAGALKERPATAPAVTPATNNTTKTYAVKLADRTDEANPLPPLAPRAADPCAPEALSTARKPPPSRRPGSRHGCPRTRFAPLVSNPRPGRRESAGTR